MSNDQLKKKLDRLRSLRFRAERMAHNFSVDHESFEDKYNPLCYFRLPSDPPSGPADGISVTPSCTAWMATSCAGIRLSKAKVLDAFKKLISEPWDTGGLPQNNPFTAAVFSRSIGFLVESKLLDLDEANKIQRDSEKYEDHNLYSKELWIKCHGKSVPDIIGLYLDNPTKNISIDPFPSSPTIGYWFVDAALKLEMDLTSSFEGFANWAAAEFRRQHSLVTATDQSLMDPIALVMSACVCKCLRTVSAKFQTCNEILKDCLFPSNVELEAGVRAFFNYQNKQTGVWERYFPIFHYPKSGPNHCWHFEVLEAVVGEFEEILDDDVILGKLTKSLEWLENNRLSFEANGQIFHGWNGGDIKAMRRGEPESWPTSIAHMFLAKLIRQLSKKINTTVLQKFGERVQVTPSDKDVSSEFPDGKKWTTYLDSDFTKAAECGLDDSNNSVKKLIEKELLLPVLNEVETPNPQIYLKSRHSAVLFGPPGTAKTSLCEAIAKRLGWYFVELSPSDFLSSGLEGIYNKVDEVFQDLLDLYGVVILFDEMDALVQDREAESKQQKLGVTETLLTTSMLPKLAKLHKDRRALYFMATNFIGTFDGAITRAGRFDLRVHMGPPTRKWRIEGLQAWCKNDSVDDIVQAQDHLSQFDNKVFEKFDRFTYAETARFLDSVKSKKPGMSIAQAITATSESEFLLLLGNWTNSKITLCDGSTALNNFEKDALSVQLQ